MKTSKRTLMVALFFAVVMLVVSGTVGMAGTVRLADGLGNTNGGIFNVTGDYIGSTFCLERNESLSFGHDYNYTIDTFAVAGGYAGGTPDPLDPKTAYLYSSFIGNTLPSWVLDAAHVDALQYAIWFIEQEITALPAGNTYAQTLYDAAVAAKWSDLGRVTVMNLYDTNGNAQSVLTPVPEPMTLLLLGLGLFGLGLGSRKFKIKK